eukprot:scaffold29728_cov21-Tisochrysis_lutea.AAC.3
MRGLDVRWGRQSNLPASRHDAPTANLCMLACQGVRASSKMDLQAIVTSQSYADADETGHAQAHQQQLATPEQLGTINQKEAQHRCDGDNEGSCSGEHQCERV